jgi:hypothetical protein
MSVLRFLQRDKCGQAAGVYILLPAVDKQACQLIIVKIASQIGANRSGTLRRDLNLWLVGHM